MAKKKKQESGGKRLLKSGKRPVTLGVEPTDHARLKRAAEIERRPLTQILLLGGLAYADRVIAGESKT